MRWPSEDGSIVVETEEDFSVFASEEPFAGTFGNSPANTIPGVGVSTRAGDAFEAKPGNVVTVDADSVTVESGPLAGNVYDALEFSGNQPRFADTGPVTGEAVWIGLACDEATTENAESFPEGGVAIARCGDCLFATKLATAAELGASAIVIANNVQNTTWAACGSGTTATHRIRCLPTQRCRELQHLCRRAGHAGVTTPRRFEPLEATAPPGGQPPIGRARRHPHRLAVGVAVHPAGKVGHQPARAAGAGRGHRAGLADHRPPRQRGLGGPIVADHACSRPSCRHPATDNPARPPGDRGGPCRSPQQPPAGDRNRIPPRRDRLARQA